MKDDKIEMMMKDKQISEIKDELDYEETNDTNIKNEALIEEVKNEDINIYKKKEISLSPDFKKTHTERADIDKILKYRIGQFRNFKLNKRRFEESEEIYDDDSTYNEKKNKVEITLQNSDKEDKNLLLYEPNIKSLNAPCKLKSGRKRLIPEER